jgi:hypothetical protein
LALALLLSVGASVSAAAEESIQLIEQKIKAGLIYNFLKYTQWPHPGPNIVVCVLGGDPFAGNLAPMGGRTVNESTIEIRAIDSIDHANGCALMVVNAERKSSWRDTKAKLTGKDVLTVSDFDGFVEAGGMIEFTHANERIGVKINVDAVAATHLVVQDRLLKLAGATGKTAPEH